MKTKMIGQILPFVAMLALVASCGTSSSGSSGSSGSDTVSEVASISDIPTSVIDPSQYDVSTNTALQANLSAKSVSKAALTGQSQFSRAGCETDRMKKNVIRNALLPKMLLCMMGAMDEVSGGRLAGDGAFNYWKAPDETGEGGPSGVDSFKPRLAVKKNASDLTFVICNDTTKAMELYISWANSLYSGHVVNKWGEGFQNKLEFTADGLPTTSAGTAGFTTATFTQTMVEASGYWRGFGSETLEATPLYNTIYGSYNEEGDNNYAGSVYARFDNTQGTARYKQISAGSYPAWDIQRTYDNCEIQSPGQCGDFDTDWLGAAGWLATECDLPATLVATDTICFSDDSDACVTGDGLCCPSVAESATCSSPAGLDTQESFAITLTDSVNHVLDFAVATTSDYAAAVAAARLPDSSAEPTIEFTSASADVDCTGSNSWTSMMTAFTSEPDFAECTAMQDEMDDWDTGELCQTLDSAASGANGVD